MPTVDTVILEEYKGALAGATHLLLIGPTKTGKTDYVVQAAIDGFNVIYVDKDNGLATISTATANHLEARKRIHYFNPENFAEWTEQFLTNGIVRYNNRTKKAPEYSDLPEDRITEIYPSRIPRNVIVCFDSWTSMCLSIMQNQADKNKVSLFDIDKYSREIYGGSGFKATQIAEGLQHLPFHVVVIGHPGIYERKEKPENRSAGTVTEKDMIIRETTDVVISTSLPHGSTLGKYFNQIGWLLVDRMNKRVIDYTIEQGRMGGGTPNTKGDPRAELRFSKVFGPVPQYDESVVWITEMSSEEMKAKATAGSKMSFSKPATPPATAAPASQTAATTPAPTGLRLAAKPNP